MKRLLRWIGIGLGALGGLGVPGVPLGGRKLGEMREWARENLSHLTDAEIAALYSYLHAMPEAAHN